MDSPTVPEPIARRKGRQLLDFPWAVLKVGHCMFDYAVCLVMQQPASKLHAGEEQVPLPSVLVADGGPPQVHVLFVPWMALLEVVSVTPRLSNSHWSPRHPGEQLHRARAPLQTPFREQSVSDAHLPTVALATRQAANNAAIAGR